MVLYDRVNFCNVYVEDFLLCESELVSFVKMIYKFFVGSLLLVIIGVLLGLMNF